MIKVGETIRLTVQSHGKNLWRLYLGSEISRRLELCRGDWFNVEICNGSWLIKTTCGINCNNHKANQIKKGYDLYIREISDCIYTLREGDKRKPIEFVYLGVFKNSNDKKVHRIKHLKNAFK